MNEAAIEIKHVSMKYRMINDRVINLKEWITLFLQRKISYKYFEALKDINVTIKKGEIVGIIGHNGAGKSTLLKIVSGILKPTNGEIKMKGNLVPMLELGSGFDPDLTGRENIYLNGAVLGYQEKYIREKYQEIVDFSELNEFIDVPLRNYSSGMMMRLAFSIATIVKPEILIVDEILAVGDASFQAKSKNRMLELMSSGTTVILVSHDLNQIKGICEKSLWIDHGVQKMYGDVSEVCAAYEETLKM